MALRSGDEMREAADRLLLRSRELVQLLGVSRTLVYRWMADGTLPVVRVNGTVRVPQEALRRWIEQHTEGGDDGNTECDSCGRVQASFKP